MRSRYPRVFQDNPLHGAMVCIGCSWLLVVFSLANMSVLCLPDLSTE